MILFKSNGSRTRTTTRQNNSQVASTSKEEERPFVCNSESILRYEVFQIESLDRISTYKSIGLMYTSIGDLIWRVRISWPFEGNLHCFLTKISNACGLSSVHAIVHHLFVAFYQSTFHAVCGRRYKTLSVLKAHRTTYHSQEAFSHVEERHEKRHDSEGGSIMQIRDAKPNGYCDFCLGDDNLNKKTGKPEKLVSCADCGRSGKLRCVTVL